MYVYIYTYICVYIYIYIYSYITTNRQHQTSARGPRARGSPVVHNNAINNDNNNNNDNIDNIYYNNDNDDNNYISIIIFITFIIICVPSCMRVSARSPGEVPNNSMVILNNRTKFRIIYVLYYNQL